MPTKKVNKNTQDKIFNGRNIDIKLMIKVHLQVGLKGLTSK